MQTALIYMVHVLWATDWEVGAGGGEGVAEFVESMFMYVLKAQICERKW